MEWKIHLGALACIARLMQIVAIFEFLALLFKLEPFASWRMAMRAAAFPNWEFLVGEVFGAFECLTYHGVLSIKQKIIQMLAKL